MAERHQLFPADTATATERELVIDFGDAGNSERFRGWGWSAAEPKHSWTLGRSSRLYLRPPTVPGTYLMVLDVTPFLWGERSGQRLNVFVNGGKVGETVVRGMSLIEVEVPWSLIAGREWFAVTFEHPDAAPPRQVGGAADDREIALAFAQISLFRKFEPRLVSGSISASGMPLSELSVQFESLGQNCEFGLVQRLCGAEPLGLLRFASTPMRSLMAGLRARFAGLGAPDQLEIEAAKDEYLITDRRYGLLYHAWVNVGEASPEEVLQREQRRLPFLRQKLLEDLEEGRKIFVYHGMEPLERAAMLNLVAALRAYGPATLLWTELADEAHPPGAVEEISTGLIKGYMDRFAPGENAHDLSLDCWVTVCRNAYALLRA